MNESEEAPLVDPDQLSEWIIYEDQDLLVFDKPGWLVCHPSKNGPWSSLVGAAKEYLNVDSIHLVSRLDRETSGVVMLAKHRKAASLWQKGVEQRKVSRRYLTILQGELSEAVHISTFLGKDPDSEVFVKQRVTEQSRKAQKSKTSFLPLGNRNQHTFCLVQTGTGRKHQIRVHAKHLGTPVVGDKLYGPNENFYLKFIEQGWRNDWFDVLGMDRQALHGVSLSFEELGKRFVAPIAVDMQEYLEREVGWGAEEIKVMISNGLENLSCRHSEE